VNISAAFKADIWRDSDAERNGNGLVFDVGGNRWFIPEHGITTSHCKYWAHYLPASQKFVWYEVEHMRALIEERPLRVTYTPKKPSAPTNRGILVPMNCEGFQWREMRAHASFNGGALVEMPRGKAGKLAELHFVGTVFAKSDPNKEISFAEAWQDMKGNDVQLSSGEWVQVKLDRGAETSGNLYVQTHTRTKGTDWLGK
jgi:hypothetical protein